MNRRVRILTPLLSAVFLILLILTVRYMLSNRFVLENASIREKRSYHFAFFLPEADYTFFNALKLGAGDAAKAMDCSISFHPIDKDLLSLDMAHYTGIQGIAVYPYRESPELRDAMARIGESGIPIVQIENRLQDGPQTVFIGTNSFDFGKAIGRLSLGANAKSLNIALVYSEKNPGLLSYGNLLEMGMKSILGQRLSLLRTYRTTTNSLDAEKLAYDLIRSADAYNLIVLTDTSDTLVSVQAIIDMNLVGSVQIVGFGGDPTIASYIEKGTVLGSIVRDSYRIGYSAVLSLSEIMQKGYTSEYVDVGLSVMEKGSRQKSARGGGE